MSFRLNCLISRKTKSALKRSKASGETLFLFNFKLFILKYAIKKVTEEEFYRYPEMTLIVTF